MDEKKKDNLFGERLRAARELLGLKQAELAATAELPPSSIALFEGGSRKPSLDNLRRLTAALDVSADFLLGHSNNPFRSEAGDKLQRDLERLSVRDRDLAEDFVRLLVQRGTAPSRREERLKRELRFKEIGDEVEKLLREEKLVTLPVPIVDLLDRFSGIRNPTGMRPEPEIEWGEMRDVAPSASGSLSYVNGLFYIEYAAGRDKAFERFAIAHELGHVLLDSHTQHVLPDLDGTHYSEANYVSADPYELEADHFASHLLMPEDLLRDKLAGLSGQAGLKVIEAIAEICHVPLAAAAIRYAELADDAVAVIISAGMAISRCRLSEKMKALEGLSVPRRGDLIPAASKTARVWFQPEFHTGARYIDRDASLADWLKIDEPLAAKEEVVALPAGRRVLTVLTVTR